MGHKIGKNTFVFDKIIRILGSGNVVGEKEGEGPLGKLFDLVVTDEYYGEESFEKAESKLQQTAVENALKNSGIGIDNIDLITGGDLLNQCIASNFAFRDNNVPFIGLYGACSTMTLSTTVAALTIESGYANNAVAVTSSHFCCAERQFRMPLEYGGQRTPTSQRTVSGSGALILTNGQGMPIKINAICIGSVIDYGIKDANNMGAAMAPAAADTLCNFFNDTNKCPEDFDLILTGDLGSHGSGILRDLLLQKGYKTDETLSDCGLIIYDNKKQDMHAGGSGCGCSAAVLSAFVIPEMVNGKYKDVLLISTGALLSPVSSLQGESIPSIAHLVHFKRL